ncbi:Similar to ATPase family gene 2 protein; acc. no. O60058 [Pyronema omphalodes CBS 100304]|uniref:Similar to ATPase family gene 2 protein acc. no. O60058 n=1 Tax=Pyronema omphalodes (strain CBS 100304) TaxID=1076935 RepID=U4L6Q5_PYROM|nr:Similar to ATPase family gene 2 protein; acc. no. O60058 [Pyronema omphalodes CBS 100304]
MLEDIQWIPNPFDNLLLPDDPRKVIRSLVGSHQYPETGARDQQELKGKGLVVLLHGTPGTGKTLTAETEVAEYTKRALLVISNGKLGQYVAQIDENLTTFLQYAAHWKAVVLIDECDIFFETRQSDVSNRLQQNSLVAGV